MKKALIMFLICIATFCFINAVMTGSAFAQKKPVLLRLVIPTPEGDWPQTFRDTEMAKRFNERAKGEYMIEVHAGFALAKLPEFFDAVRIGAVEMAACPWGAFSFLDPRLGLLEIPFYFNNNYAVGASCREMAIVFDDVLKKFNAKALSLWNSGGLNIHSQKPVRTLKDWKGLLVGAISPPTADLIKILGGAPVTIPFPDIYMSLQKKVIDASIFGCHGGNVYGFNDICKYYTAFHGVSAYNGYSINLDVWNKMPPNIQKILQEETIKAAEWNNNVVVTELPEMDLKVFKEKGVEVYYVPKAERDIWAGKFKSYTEEKLSAAGELGNKVKRIVEDCNKKYPYSSEDSAGLL